MSTMIIKDINEELKIKQLYVKNYEPEFVDSMFVYKINNYIPFHTASYVSFRSLDGHPDLQKDYLRRFVKRHISQFFRFVNVDKEEFQKNLSLELISFEERPTRLLYNTMLKPFDIRFRANIMLPGCIGLGRLNKYGFGNLLTEDNQ